MRYFLLAFLIGLVGLAAISMLGIQNEGLLVGCVALGAIAATLGRSPGGLAAVLAGGVTLIVLRTTASPDAVDWMSTAPVFLSIAMGFGLARLLPIKRADAKKIADGDSGRVQ